MLPSVSLAQAIADLERLTDEVGPGVVAFDGDGTLWTGDIADDVVHRLLGERLLRSGVRDALHAAFVSPTEDPHTLFAEIVAADKAGTFDHRVTCELVGSLLAGWGVDEFHAFCVETLRGTRLEDRLIPEAWALRRRAAELGHAVLVVSASPLAIVAGASAVVGAPNAALGVEVVVVDHVYTTAIARPIPYAEGKVAAVARLAGAAPLLAAFGDNRFDLAMLAAAKLPFAVRPKPALINHAGELVSRGLRMLVEG